MEASEPERVAFCCPMHEDSPVLVAIILSMHCHLLAGLENLALQMQSERITYPRSLASTGSKAALNQTVSLCRPPQSQARLGGSLPRGTPSAKAEKKSHSSLAKVPVTGLSLC